MTSRFERQLAVVNQEDLESLDIHMAGAGGIGGITAMLLTKMGCTKLTVYDFDDIEEHNVSNQIYGPSHLGQPKVDALVEVVKLIDDIDIKTVNDKMTECYGDILIFAVDSIEIRKSLFEANKTNFRYLIDGRMSAEEAEVFVVDLLEEDQIEKYLKSFEGEFQPLPCTARATIYNSAIIGGVITSSVKKIAMKQPLQFRTFIACSDNTMMTFPE